MCWWSQWQTNREGFLKDFGTRERRKTGNLKTATSRRQGIKTGNFETQLRDIETGNFKRQLQDRQLRDKGLWQTISLRGKTNFGLLRAYA